MLSLGLLATLVVLAMLDLAVTVYTWRQVNARSCLPRSAFPRFVPRSLLFADALRFTPVKILYVARMLVSVPLQTGLVWLVPALRTPVTESDVCELALETSLLTMLRGTPDRAILQIRKFASPLIRDKLDCTLRVLFDFERRR